MRIILRKAARTHKPMNGATHFVTIHGTELKETHGQIFVRVNRIGIQHYVTWAIHGFHAVFGIAWLLVGALVHFEEVHIVVIKIVVTRGFPHVSLINVWRYNLFVATRVQLFAQPRLKNANDLRTFRKIQRQTGASHVAHHVNSQVFAQFAMVALFGFRKCRQVRI